MIITEQYKILESIDEFLMSGEHRQRTSHYVSDVCACRRQLYWKWTNEEQSNPITPGGIFKMRMGGKVEDVLEDWLIWAKENKKIKDYILQFHQRINIPGLQYPLGMRADVIVITIDDRWIGIEIKSSYGAGIKLIQQKQEPKEEHLYQVYPYMKYLDIKEFVLIYFGRDNGYRTEFFIQQHEQGLLVNNKLFQIDWDGKIQRLKDLELALRMNFVPPQDFQVAIKDGEIKDYQHEKVKYKSDWQCKYCAFQDKCWSDMKEKYSTGNNAEMLNAMS
jgi:CRISPR/Cas system-associated exonuclease Cas4 (RecB family)